MYIYTDTPISRLNVQYIKDLENFPKVPEKTHTHTHEHKELLCSDELSIIIYAREASSRQDKMPQRTASCAALFYIYFRAAKRNTDALLVIANCMYI